jgi:hypothetical protein
MLVDEPVLKESAMIRPPLFFRIPSEYAEGEVRKNFAKSFEY